MNNGSFRDTRPFGRCSRVRLANLFLNHILRASMMLRSRGRATCSPSAQYGTPHSRGEQFSVEPGRRRSERAVVTADSTDWRDAPARAAVRQSHAARASSLGRAGAVGLHQQRRGDAISLAATTHGRRIRALHRLDAPAARRRHAGVAWPSSSKDSTLPSASFSCVSSNRASGPPSGASPSDRRSGAPACSGQERNS